MEEIFAGFVISSKENEDVKIRRFEEEMRNLIKALGAPESIEHAFRKYIDYTADIASERKVTLLLSLLEYAIQNHLLSAKLVCEWILNSKKLVYENEAFWCCSFTFINKVIGLADYKGVRDIVKLMLDKVNTVPANTNVSILSQLNAMYKVFINVFDRNNCLLPAYLVLDEIQKKMYPKGRWPHWKFAKLLSSFVESFRPTAQMVTIACRSKLLPIVSYSSSMGNTWKLDPINAKFQLRASLPYNKELLEPQTHLLRYVLEKPYSRDMVYSMLSLSNEQKQRCPILEEQLVELVLMAMERSENESDSGDVSEQTTSQTVFFWQHLSSHLIYFVLYHHASFPHMVESLHDKLAAKNLRKGRDHLMWVLLQFISGAIQKKSLVDFLPIIKLHDLLYPEKEPISVPDITKPSCTHAMAIASIWIHLMKKAELEPVKLQRPLPVSLKKHVDCLQQSLMSNNLHSSFYSDYQISLLCNAYSTNQEYFTRPMGVLVDAVQGNNRNNNNSGVSNGQVTPLSMNILDSLTVHTKMR
ncbi:mediator of RNA polymerase II transcription subunit 23-like protein [Dinothrombium tinctorium]|uniref:Mediator of RNA polymerase II transcription subunit 23 n=1 Tax=Dinothrombium tinctorium TaxID=1965070 RepID=A0A3S3SRA1_9ACAR|nr:mediator of RNA polymerase II transcription subunit 23-like protein [Dinothrombium tinctorium]